MQLNEMMPRLQSNALKYLFILGIMSAAYCSFKPKPPSTTGPMTAKKALIAAIQYFPDKEYESIENYEISVVDSGDHWNVYFTQYKPERLPGGHFIIEVAKGRESIKLIPGE